MDSAIPEKGNRRVTRHLGKGAVHRGEGKREEKVRCRSRERCRVYIDGVEALRRPENGVKAARGRAIPKAVGTILQQSHAHT